MDGWVSQPVPGALPPNLLLISLPATPAHRAPGRATGCGVGCMFKATVILQSGNGQGGRPIPKERKGNRVSLLLENTESQVSWDS